MKNFNCVNKIKGNFINCVAMITNLKFMTKWAGGDHSDHGDAHGDDDGDDDDDHGDDDGSGL